MAYFSATGTVKTLAEYAADAMAADLYEIIPEEPYIDEDLDYGNDQSRSSLEIWTFEALETHYKTLVRYLNLDDQGMVLGYGCGTVSMTRHSEYPGKEIMRQTFYR